MKVLYINAAFREGSRTDYLARKYMECVMPDSTIEELDLGSISPAYLDRNRIKTYCESVATRTYNDEMFDFAKQFRDAEEIVIAAPFWNCSIPAVLHAYLEIVCSQGVTFDVASDGTYLKLCKAKRLSFVTTAGGPLPQENHAFGFINQMNDWFWGIPDVVHVKAECMDIDGNDPTRIMEDALAPFF